MHLVTGFFRAEKDFSKLLKYEFGLEELFRRRRELSGIYQYHQDTLPKEVMRQNLVVHPGIFISDTPTRINRYYMKSSMLAELKTNDKMDEMITSLCKM